MNKHKFIVFLIMILGLTASGACSLKKGAFYSYVKGDTGIGGIVTYNGAPMEEVEVYLYRNTKSNFRGPADFGAITNAVGWYFLDIPRGNYYIIARKRQREEMSGPVKIGDYYSDPIYEPILVKDGEMANVNLALKQLSGALALKESGQKKTDTSISGIIINESGIPVKGVYAFAYKNEDTKREPDYFSVVTDETGAFIIYLEKGGRYRIGSRSSIKGEPKIGDLYGLYEGALGDSIFLKDRENIKGIKITLKEYKK